MEVPDRVLCDNRDWDPSYLASLFSTDFFEFNDLWHTDITDSELLKEMDKVECYSPLVEDISLEDEELCQAVERIELE